MSTPPTPKQDEVMTISYVEVMGTTPGRIGKTDVIVSYKFDDAHVFQVVIPKETFNEAEIDRAVRADFQAKRKYIGRVVRV